MGVVIQGEPSNRVALLIPLKTQHQFKMRAFIAVLACVGVVFAGEDMFGMKKMQKTWAEHKAMESCFGENMMKTSLLKMKKAVVKCTGMAMPELDLPMYNNPHRFVHALLEGAEDLKTMKMFKAMSMLSGNGVSQDSQNQFKFFQNMMNAMNRNKRATDDLFELGDRLTDKLKQETEEWQAKLGNASCVLKELDIIDQNENLDISGMVQSVERGEWGEFPDQWLKEQHIKDCRTCATFADSIPKTVFEECAWGEKWGRIMMFFQCEKDTKYKTCMNHDMKLKLEKSFGSLESLEEATGLPEYQLLPMTMKLLNEQMDMFM